MSCPRTLQYGDWRNQGSKQHLLSLSHPVRNHLTQPVTTVRINRIQITIAKLNNAISKLQRLEFNMQHVWPRNKTCRVNGFTNSCRPSVRVMLTNQKHHAPCVPFILTKQTRSKATAYTQQQLREGIKSNFQFGVCRNGVLWTSSNLGQFRPKDSCTSEKYLGFEGADVEQRKVPCKTCRGTVSTSEGNTTNFSSAVTLYKKASQRHCDCSIVMLLLSLTVLRVGNCFQKCQIIFLQEIFICFLLLYLF